MSRRILETLAFASLVIGIVVWGTMVNRPPREKKTTDLPSGDSFHENRQPSDADVQAEVHRKAVEYVQLFIVPGLPRPNSGVIPEDAIKITAPTEAGLWETSGVLYHTGDDGTSIGSKWQISIRYHDGRFSPLSVRLDGQELPIPNPR
jgi:hypothetical protein